jgi:hypothetical protein
VSGGRTQNEFVSDFLSDHGGRFDSYSPVGVRFRPLASEGKILCFVEVDGGAGRDRTAE